MLIDHGRLEFATIWLNEEWYNDRKYSSSPSSSAPPPASPTTPSVSPSNPTPTRQPQYPTLLTTLLKTYISSSQISPKDRTLQLLLLDLPEVPGSVLEELKGLCLIPDRWVYVFLISKFGIRTRVLVYLLGWALHIMWILMCGHRMLVGFPTLRELCTIRPPLRKEGMRILLDLCTHPGKSLHHSITGRMIKLPSQSASSEQQRLTLSEDGYPTSNQWHQ